MKTTRRAFCGAAPALLLGQGKKSAPPNIIIFYVDELRETALKMYRSDGLAMPNLERLASRGVIFNNAFTPHPLCMPARSSLWTGQYAHTHGIRCNMITPGVNNYLHDDRQTMCEVLHKAGYRTGIFGKNHVFSPSQLGKWFDVDYSYPTNDPFIKDGMNKGLTAEDLALVQQNRDWVIKERHRPTVAPFKPEIFETHVANQRGMEFIEREAGKGPFCAWISILAPHGPLEVPREYAGAMPPDRVKLPPFSPNDIKLKNRRMHIYDAVMQGPEMTDDFLRRFISIYMGMTAFIDHELGRLMALLEQKGLVDNTIILFTADHGDFAAEHHLIYKCGSMVESMVHIPFVMSWPGHIPQGRREEALVNQVDIMPTLLDFCGLPVPGQCEGQPLPFGPQDPRRSWVYSEYGGGEREYTLADDRKAAERRAAGSKEFTDSPTWQLLTRERSGHLQMARTATHKLALDSNGEIEFYDLVKDPWELENVHGKPEYREIEHDLEKKLG